MKTLQQHTQAHMKRSSAGFTLVELIAALAILVVLGTMVAAAMTTGARIMTTSTTGSNAAVLEQSIDTALDDLLRYASVRVPAGTEILNDPSFDSDSALDASGAAVRMGKVVIQNGMIALSTTGGIQPIPRSTGIYTDFVVTDLQLSYDCASNLFTGEYTLSNESGSYTRTCSYACKSLVEETKQ